MFQAMKDYPGASRPEEQIVSCLMHQFDLFGLDYRGAFKLLMDGGRWKEWIDLIMEGG